MDFYTCRNLSGAKCGTLMCWELRAWGRVASTATRVHLQMGSVGTDVPVTDGWFAYQWLTSPTTARAKDLQVVAYDKDNKVVRVLE
ncbi:hypothetical protein [Kribbella sp. NPDC048915]|uniref:hypothetical protein n=1 Tax=Kribbella sp. NPDC048915 TaxID=3155148 RepID=UPI00340FDED6